MNWILLRGLGRESRHWFQFENQMAESHQEILCLDLPGFGMESNITPPLTIQETTDFVRSRFFEKRKTSDTWAVLGISLGGMVALDWIKRYPTDFKMGVFINPSTKDLSPIHHRMTAYAVYCMTRALFTKDPKQAEKQILKMISNEHSKNGELLDQLKEIRGEKYNTYHLARQLFAASRFISPSKLEIPTLVLASLKDRMVDVRCSKALAERLQCEIKFHPTAGHDLPLDDANWVIEKISDFLKTHQT